jgi:protein tyrosine/serine phosphatase
MTDSTIARVLPLTGIHNFRDYGGYALAGGGRLRGGILWRSGQHVDATADDLAAVDALDLATVIDLRGNSERAAFPCARGPGFRADVRWFDGETAGSGGAVHQGAARDVVSVADAMAAMISLYSFMPHRPNLQTILRDYFTTLAAGEGGGHLVHCFAGKDRTGFAVALLHHLLGVHADDAMADYMLTATAGNSAARIAAGVDNLRRRRPEAEEDALAMLMGVEPEWLMAAFTTLDTDFAGPENYARVVLGVDAVMLDRIRARLKV